MRGHPFGEGEDLFEIQLQSRGRRAREEHGDSKCGGGGGSACGSAPCRAEGFG